MIHLSRLEWELHFDVRFKPWFPGATEGSSLAVSSCSLVHSEKEWGMASSPGTPLHTRLLLFLTTTLIGCISPISQMRRLRLGQLRNSPQKMQLIYLDFIPGFSDTNPIGSVSIYCFSKFRPVSLFLPSLAFLSSQAQLLGRTSHCHVVLGSCCLGESQFLLSPPQGYF